MKRKTLADSPAYRSFVDERDRALEQIHRNAQLEISDHLRGALRRTLEIISYQYSQIPGDFFFTQTAIHIMGQIEYAIKNDMQHAAFKIIQSFKKMKRSTYLLAYTGEAEAIARVMVDGIDLTVNKDELDARTHSKTARNEELDARVWLALERITRDIIDALETAKVMEEPLLDCIDRVKKSFPKEKFLKQPRRILRPIKEAEFEHAKGAAKVSQGIIDGDEWQKMLGDYKTEYVPYTRSIDAPLGASAQEYEGMYVWEVEQELTNEFVNEVRQGENAAASKNGFTDFVWISVIDAATDECCLWRDGLLVSEIEAQLNSEHADDECEGIVPPVHINCRCRLAPATDEIPDKPSGHIGDFESWLDEATI